MSAFAIAAAVALTGCLGVGAALVVVDLRAHRLPNRLVLPLYPAGVVIAALRSLDGGSPAPIAAALACALALFGAFYLLYRFGAGLGGGDVKLAGAIGVVTGGYGWAVPLAAVALAFVLGGLAALALIALGRAGATTRIAFGPFLVVGATAAVLGAIAQP